MNRKTTILSLIILALMLSGVQAEMLDPFQKCAEIITASTAIVADCLRVLTVIVGFGIFMFIVKLLAEHTAKKDWGDKDY